MEPNQQRGLPPNPNVRKARNATHVWRMKRKRFEQQRRRANCSPFGRKLVSEKYTDPRTGQLRTRTYGVERGDEQKEYRTKHWHKEKQA